nr:hypothetical protein [Desulfospira joergensenii]
MGNGSCTSDADLASHHPVDPILQSIPAIGPEHIFCRESFGHPIRYPGCTNQVGFSAGRIGSNPGNFFPCHPIIINGGNKMRNNSLVQQCRQSRINTDYDGLTLCLTDLINVFIKGRAGSDDDCRHIPESAVQLLQFSVMVHGGQVLEPVLDKGPTMSQFCVPF